MNKMNEKISDHDLLIRLDQKVGDLQIAVRELSTGTVLKIATLEKDKADRIELDNLQIKVNHDIEVRVRGLESSRTTYLTTTIIYAAIGATMIGLILYHLFQK